MIKARHNRFYVWFFSFLAKRGLRCCFRSVNVTCNADPAGRPVLIIGNRFSWWDALIAYYLNDKLFKKKFHIMVLEEQLIAHPSMNRAGAFPVRRASRTSVDTLKYASGLMHDSDNLLALYPQDSISSIHRRPIRFERGVERIIAGSSDRLMILFYVALPDWFTGKRPSLSVRIIEYSARERTLADLEETYNMFFEEAVMSQQPPRHS